MVNKQASDNTLLQHCALSRKGVAGHWGLCEISLNPHRVSCIRAPDLAATCSYRAGIGISSSEGLLAVA